jgi:hypothetical protein
MASLLPELAAELLIRLLAPKCFLHKRNNKYCFPNPKRTVSATRLQITFHPICSNCIHKHNLSSPANKVVSSNEGNRLMEVQHSKSSSINHSKKPKSILIQAAKLSHLQASNRSVN